MKLVLYNDFQLGVVQEKTVMDAGAAVAGLGHHSPQEMMEMLIRGWDDLGPKIEAAVAGQPGQSLDSVQLRAPLPRPGQLVCLAGNYIEPRAPERGAFNAFIKSNTAIVGQGATIDLPSAEASVFHFEPELALVIGKRASKLAASEALDYVFGYTQFIDGSARGLPAVSFWAKAGTPSPLWGRPWLRPTKLPTPTNWQSKCGSTTICDTIFPPTAWPATCRNCWRT